MNIKGVLIQGSSNSTGNSSKIVACLADLTGFDAIDLKTKNIGSYDYQYANSNDDFIPLMKEIVAKYDTLVFVTPVYWYTMSGIMKTFFDRITDCLKTEKETGRKLRGKHMAMISCSEDPELKPGFNMPFIESANYLGMHYLGDLHTWIETDQISEHSKNALHAFANKHFNLL